MITVYQANKENNHIRKVSTYTPPDTTYIGLSTADTFDDSGNVPTGSEPTFDTYARAEVTNSSATWGESANGKITNANAEIAFAEFGNEATGIAKWIFEADSQTSTSNTVMYYAKLEPEIALTPYLTIRFNRNDIELSRTNPTVTSS